VSCGSLVGSVALVVGFVVAAAVADFVLAASAVLFVVIALVTLSAAVVAPIVEFVAGLFDVAGTITEQRWPEVETCS
jgi:hypothetical protein